MKSQIQYLFLTLCLLGCYGNSLFAQNKAATLQGEASTEVPALSAFHEVIYPLWHQAWASKNTGMMKDLLPKVKDNMVQLEKAELPGILREKKTAWESGVKEMAVCVAKYEVAAAKDNPKELLDAVEKLHGTYEKLVRIIRPALEELDAYHQVLYQVYQYYMPKKNMASLRKASKELVERCKSLDDAKLPELHVKKETAFRSELSKLCAATNDFAGLMKAKKQKLTAVKSVVERMHAQYQAVQAVFE